MSERTAVLWHYPFSHFNEKARWALDFKGVPHVRKPLLPLMPAWMWVTRGGTLPVLDLDGERIRDSTSIIEALEARWPEPSLYPRDGSLRDRALELEDFFDEELGHDIRRAFFIPLAARRDLVARTITVDRGPVVERVFGALLPLGWTVAKRRYRFFPEEAEPSWEKIVLALDRIEAELADANYLVGDRFTVADLTAASLLAPAVVPDRLGLPPPGEWPERALAVRDEIMGRTTGAWVERLYRRHRVGSAEIKR